MVFSRFLVGVCSFVFGCLVGLGWVGKRLGLVRVCLFVGLDWIG